MSRTFVVRRIFSFTFLAAGLPWLAAPAAPARADILYAANALNNTIERFTSSGVGSVFARSGLNAPIALAFDGSGNLYAANSNGNTIEKFTPGGVGSVFASTGSSSPDGLAFDRAGNLYVANNAIVANRWVSTIEKFTPGGVGSVFASSGLNATHRCQAILLRTKSAPHTRSYGRQRRRSGQLRRPAHPRPELWQGRRAPPGRLQL